MGRRNVSGVEVRENSIRIVFTRQGRQVKETLYLDNAPLAPTPPNVKYAARIAAEVKDKIRAGAFRYSDYFPKSPRANVDAAQSAAEFMDTWYAQLDLKNSTVSGYRRMKDNFWKPKIGHIPLDKVKHSDITKALKDGGWDSGKTRNNYLSMISNVFALAVADESIAKNPCEKIEAASWQKKPPDPFSLAEAERIISSFQERYPQQVANYAEFMFFSGLRTSEGLGLEWSNIDFASRTLRVEQAFVINDMEDTTKTSVAREVA